MLTLAYVLFQRQKDPNSCKYVIGMIANLEAIFKHCPTAQVWIYFDKSVCKEWLSVLRLAQRQCGLKITLKPFHFPAYFQEKEGCHIGLSGALFRYFSISEFCQDAKTSNQDSVLAVRDADVVFNQTDLKFLTQFQQNPEKWIHRYVDVKHYPWPFIGGSFALKKLFLQKIGLSWEAWNNLIMDFAKRETKEKIPFAYFNDQRFLRDQLFLSLKKKKLLHLVETQDIHIPSSGEKVVKKKNMKNHYRVWWCDIGDEVQDVHLGHLSVRKWLFQNSETFQAWTNKDKQIVVKGKKKRKETTHSSFQENHMEVGPSERKISEKKGFFY